MKKDIDEELEALDLVDTALYNLQEQVCKLQAEHYKVVKIEMMERHGNRISEN